MYLNQAQGCASALLWLASAPSTFTILQFCETCGSPVRPFELKTRHGSAEPPSSFGYSTSPQAMRFTPERIEGTLASRSMSIERHQCSHRHVHRSQLGGPAEIRQVDDETGGHHIGPDLAK